MTGWRIGYAGGPQGSHQGDEDHSEPDHLQPVQHLPGRSRSRAGRRSVLHRTDGLKAYKERSDFVVAALNEIPGFECREGEGAFYAFPRVTGAMKAKGLQTDADLVELLLNQADVVMVPGTPFGAPGYVRISFACSIDELKESINRIRKGTQIALANQACLT